MAYNPRKAAQTIAFFAKQAGGHINVLKAVKLVYLADRESIKRFGFPIQDEVRVSMPHGPVNSSTYSYMAGDYEDEGWSEFLTDRAGHQVGLTSGNLSLDDLDELSDADISVLEVVWERFGHMGQFEIRDWSHVPSNVPEWQDPRGSSRPIALEEIMRHTGVPVEQAAVVRDMDRIDSLLRSF